MPGAGQLHQEAACSLLGAAVGWARAACTAGVAGAALACALPLRHRPAVCACLGQPALLSSVWTSLDCQCTPSCCLCTAGLQLFGPDSAGSAGGAHARTAGGAAAEPAHNAVRAFLHVGGVGGLQHKGAPSSPLLASRVPLATPSHPCRSFGRPATCAPRCSICSWPAACRLRTWT